MRPKRIEMSEQRGRLGQGSRGKTERRGNKIMENWSRELQLKSGG